MSDMVQTSVSRVPTRGVTGTKRVGGGGGGGTNI